MTLLRITTLMGATLTMGLVAGVFALFAHTIMPGLRKTDDRTFVTAFQQIDRAIINPWFMITAFGGALVLTLVAGLANRGTPALPLIAAAFGLYLVAVIITVAVNGRSTTRSRARAIRLTSTSRGSGPSSTRPAGPPGTWSGWPPASRPSGCSPGRWCSAARRQPRAPGPPAGPGRGW